MATYAELYTLKIDSTLLQKVEVACWIAADTIRLEDAGTANHANRLKWAKAVLADAKNVAYTMLPAILAQNKAATLLQITGATDAALQTAVNNAVDVLAQG